MSRYGKLWERAREVRELLRELGAPTGSVAEVKEFVKTTKDKLKRIEALQGEWAIIEQDMAREPDEGRPVGR